MGRNMITDVMHELTRYSRCKHTLLALWGAESSGRKTGELCPTKKKVNFLFAANQHLRGFTDAAQVSTYRTRFTSAQRQLGPSSPILFTEPFNWLKQPPDSQSRHRPLCCRNKLDKYSTSFISPTKKSQLVCVWKPSALRGRSDRWKTSLDVRHEQGKLRNEVWDGDNVVNLEKVTL